MTTNKKGWYAFSAILATLVVLTIALQFSSRKKLHRLALDREASSHVTTLKKLLKEVELNFLENDLLFIDLGMKNLVHSENEYLEAIALRCLEIEQTVGVFAFQSDGRKIDLPTDSNRQSADPSRAIKLGQLPYDFLFTKDKAFSVLYPIGEEAEIGYIELLIDPAPLLIERKAIDTEILQQGLWVFGVGSGLVFLIFRFLLSRLLRTEEILRKKSMNLKEVNLRLAQACKTAGVGAVTAHLMHALKTPVMGLKNLELETESQMDDTRKSLLATTHKIETLISNTLNSLRECDLNEESYSFQAQEVLNLAAKNFNEQMNDDRVYVLESPASGQKIDNLKANLILPVLHNLIQNSIESGSSVKIFLQAEQKEGTLTLMVRDDGPGISAKQQKNLFKPVISQKENGSGIGLAISKELATRAGASLRLIESNNKGTCFSINIPTSTNHC